MFISVKISTFLQIVLIKYHPSRDIFDNVTKEYVTRFNGKNTVEGLTSLACTDA